jgi:hypothetical protein
LVGKFQDKRPFRRSKRRYKVNIKVTVLEIERKFIEWIRLDDDSVQVKSELSTYCVRSEVFTAVIIRIVVW